MRISPLLMAGLMAAGAASLLAQTAKASIATGLVVHYTFDDNTTNDTLAADSQGNHDGTLVDSGGLPGFSTGSQGTGLTDTHVLGAGAIDFGGVGGYLSAADTTGSPLDWATGAGQPRSVSFWFQETETENLVVMEKYTNRHFIVQTFPNGRMAWRINYPYILTDVVNDGTWHHLVGTYDGSTARTYVDGVYQGSETQIAHNDDNNPLVLGARAGGSFDYDGKLDDVGIWERELSADEVTLIYGAGLNGQNLAEVSVPNLITGISYEYDPASTFHGNYPDVQDGSGNWTKLIDGQFDNTPDFLDGTWVGCRYPDGGFKPSLTFDLGDGYPLDEIFIVYMAGDGAGINPPDSVDVSFSTDGVNFSSPMSFTPFPAAGGALFVDKVALDVYGIYATHVQLDFHQDNQWTFLGEIQFTMVPEPGALLLLVLGVLVALPALGRRRKR